MELSFKTIGSDGTECGFLGGEVVVFVELSFKTIGSGGTECGFLGGEVAVFVELSFKTIGSGGTECGSAAASHLVRTVCLSKGGTRRARPTTVLTEVGHPRWCFGRS